MICIQPVLNISKEIHFCYNNNNNNNNNNNKILLW